MSSQPTPNIGSISSLLPWQVRSVTDKLTNLVMNYTEAEAKVREATNEDPWGPTGPQLQEISRYTYTYETYHEAVSMLWRRMLQDREESWRRVYKSLLVLDYVVKNGSERAVTSAKEHVFELKQLVKYTFLDAQGKDQGLNVRNRAKELVELLQDDERLRGERQKARRSKEKFVGMSSDEAPFYQNSASRRVSGMPSSNRESSMSTTTRRDDQDDSYSDRYEWKDDAGSIAEPADYHSRDAGSKNDKRSSDIGGDLTPPRTLTPAAVSGVIPQSKQQSASSRATVDLLGDLGGADTTSSAAATNSAAAAGNASFLSDFSPFQSNTNNAPATNSNLFDQQQPQPNTDFVPDFSSAFSSLSQPAPPTQSSMFVGFADFDVPKTRPSSSNNIPSVLPAPPPPRSTITINRSSSSGLVGNLGSNLPQTFNAGNNNVAPATRTSLNDDLFDLGIGSTNATGAASAHDKNHILQSFMSAPTGLPPTGTASLPFAQQQQPGNNPNDFDIFSSPVQPSVPATGVSIMPNTSSFSLGMPSMSKTAAPSSSLMNFDMGFGGGSKPLTASSSAKPQPLAGNTATSPTSAAAAAGKTWQNLDRPVNINIDASTLVGSGLKNKSLSMYEMALKKQQQHQQVTQTSAAPQSPSGSFTPLQPISSGPPATSTAAAPAVSFSDDNSLI